MYIWSQSTDSNHAALTYERLFNRPTRSYAMFAMFIIFFEQNFIAIYAAETGGDSDSDLSIREHPVQCMPVGGVA